MQGDWKPKRRRLAALALAVLGSFLVSLGAASATYARKAASARKNSPYPPGVQVIKLKGRSYPALFQEVWQNINAIYPSFALKEVNWAEVRKEYAPQAAKASSDDEFHQVLTRMVSELKDSHTRVVAPQQNRQGRLALELRPANGSWVVVTGKHARQETELGLKAGMELMALNRQPIDKVLARFQETSPGGTEAARKLEAMDQALRGRPGDTAEVTLRTAHGKTMTINMTYEVPTRSGSESRFGRKGRMQVVREAEFDPGDTRASTLGYRKLPGGWGYIKLSSFMNPPGGAFDQALSRLHPVKGLVIDIRGNGGGIMGNGDQLVGRLIDKPIAGGSIVRRNGQKMNMGIRPQGNNFTGPVALLIDEKVASTAEHVAACLQDARRAILVGQTTAGASGNPVVLALPTRAYVQVSSWDHFRPNGERIEGIGVKPDILVSLDPREMKERQDPFIKAAITALAKGHGPPAAAKEE